jgi:7,8-dihydropterin-6-yl-methyl-4-(beta-D-ribofuranosyl)aminobenzene 5'-phosphate synthase
VSFRISPLWWPVLVLSSPVLVPMLLMKNRRYRRNLLKAQEVNAARIAKAESLPLPELEYLELTVLVEHKTCEGFLGAPGVSYWLKSDLGAVLFDVGYGPEMPALSHNADKLGFTTDRIDALVISHLHPDHMGGFRAVRANCVTLPAGLGAAEGRPCFVPGAARADGFQTELVQGPRMLTAGIASTGPLARGLFLMGWTEEQAIIARLKGKGLVVLTGCGHPTIQTILRMVRRLSREPIYAVGGGLHFPITDSPLRRPGLKVQMIWGTGKPPWKRITDQDLTTAIHTLNNEAPKRVFLSAHDTCDHSIDRLTRELEAETEVLTAGATYRI